MREDAFRAWLQAGGYTDKAAATRLSRGRKVERLLHVDLDSLDLAPATVLDLRRRLTAEGQTGVILASLLNAIRTYRRFRAGEAPGLAGAHSAASRDDRPRMIATTTPAMPVVERARTPLVVASSTAELMALHGEVLDELRARGVLRTANGPVGDHAEHLFASAFCWELVASSTAGHDAVDSAGVRYQIKGRRLTGIGSRQLGAIRRIDERAFDVLAAVLFTPELLVSRAALIPFHVVLSRAKRVEHVNGWRLMLTDAVWHVPGVIDVTAQLQSVRV